MNKNKKGYNFLISIILILFLLLIIQNFTLKPCSKSFLEDEIDYNISEYPYYELDISNNLFQGSGNAEIIIKLNYFLENEEEPSFFSTSEEYILIKSFRLKEMKYLWETKNNGMEKEIQINKNIRENPTIKSNNVMFLIPLPEQAKNLKLDAYYSSICNKN